MSLKIPEPQLPLHEIPHAAFNDTEVKLWQGRGHKGWALAMVIQVWERLGSG